MCLSQAIKGFSSSTHVFFNNAKFSSDREYKHFSGFIYSFDALEMAPHTKEIS